MTDYDFLIPNIEYFNERKCTPHWSIEESVIDFHDLTYVISGKATYYVNHTPIEITPGNLLYIPPGALRSAKTDPDNLLIMYAVNFNWLYQSDLILPFETKTYIPWKSQTKFLYTTLNRLWREHKPGYILETRSVFCLILSTFLKEHNELNAEKSEKSVYIEKVKDYIVNNYSNHKINVSLLAELVDISPNYLSTLFKKQEKISITSYLNQIRVQNAMELIITENTPIYEIAEHCGFTDAYYFSKVFKAFYGVSPINIRK